MKLSKEWDFEDAIECPICNDNYVHFIEAKNINGEDNYKAWEGKGDAIKIPCWCENGDHKFNIIIGFHKGNTYLTYKEITDGK
jgi:hypothetical protein